MTIYAPAQRIYSFFLTPDRGLSEGAKDMRGVNATTRDASSSLLEFLKTQAVQQIGNALTIASSDDWDGYQALASDPSAFSYAYSFINQLPINYPIPEIAIDSDGEIALEWDYDARRIFSLRIGRDGSLNYAGLLGHSSFHGAEIMRDNIPFGILDGIDRVTNNRL